MRPLVCGFSSADLVEQSAVPKESFKNKAGAYRNFLAPT